MSLTLLHLLYVLFIVCIIGFMLKRTDTTLITILGIFVMAIFATSSLTMSVSAIFTSFIYAMTELLPTILVISIIVALSKILTVSGVNDTMITPFTKLIRTDVLAYWVIGIVMMIISWFFWPSPAVALLGAVLLPVAVRVGLPAIGVAVAMNLFGHGIALSSDFVIQAAPKLTADAAGIPVTEVISASIPLVITMGIVTTVSAFYMLKREIKTGKLVADPTVYEQPSEKQISPISPKWRTFYALLIPFLFALNILAMSIFTLQGGEATALIGGTSILLILLLSVSTHKARGLEKTTSYLIEGFQFGFKVFGPVIPIAAFFYLGDAGFETIIGTPLPEGSSGIVNDLGIALAGAVPITTQLAAVTLTAVGAITGLDGSGFSGISLVGSLADLFGTAIGSGTATLTALGQLAAIWVGGGTIIPWALIPAAAICGVDPFELARRNILPVMIGLTATTVVAMFLL